MGYHVGMSRDAMRAEMERERREYRAAVARLSPADRADWAEYEASHEWFDGESAIAHSALRSWLARRNRPALKGW